MDLHRDAVGPWPECPFPGERYAGLVEHRAARTGPRLGEPLRHAGTEGEAGIHQARGQVGHGPVRPLAKYPVPDALGECDAIFDSRRLGPVEQVRRVHRVPAGP